MILIDFPPSKGGGVYFEIDVIPEVHIEERFSYDSYK